MKNSSENSGCSEKSTYYLLWWAPALAALTIVLAFLISGTWSWGFMDDHYMIGVPGNTWQRFSTLHHQLNATGRFYPAYLLHTAYLYKAFLNNPHAFFLFRFLEVMAALFFWGYLSYQATGKKIAFPLFCAVCLSFIKFYDAFFYLSTQEILGLMFSGAAALFILKGLNDTSKQTLKLSFGIILLAIAVSCKEPFLAVGAALGLSLILTAKKQPQPKKSLFIGLALLGASIAFGLYLKLAVSQGYSAAYSLTDWSKITANIKAWASKVLLSHAPWLAITIFVITFKKIRPAAWWGLTFGILSYGAYALLILPWSLWGHYVTPLAVFFAFSIAILLAEGIEDLKPIYLAPILILSLGLNIAVASLASNHHATYQKDSANLIQWISENGLFNHELSTGAAVGCNANEPCTAIPKLANRFYQKSFPEFNFKPQVRELLEDKNIKYYIWGPVWGDQDLRRLGNMWTPMFLSDHWVVFRRMY